MPSKREKISRRKASKGLTNNKKDDRVVFHVNRLLEPLRKPPWNRDSEDLAIILQFCTHLPFISQFSGKGGFVSDLQKNIASMLGVRVCHTDEVIFEVSSLVYVNGSREWRDSRGRFPKRHAT